MPNRFSAVVGLGALLAICTGCGGRRAIIGPRPIVADRASVETSDAEPQAQRESVAVQTTSSAPPLDPEAVRARHLRNAVGLAYSEILLDPVLRRYAPGGLGLSREARGKVSDTHSHHLRTELISVDGAEALVILGCIAHSCSESYGVLAIDLATGETFVAGGRSDRASLYRNNRRLVGIMSAASPNGAWTNVLNSNPGMVPSRQSGSLTALLRNNVGLSYYDFVRVPGLERYRLAQLGLPPVGLERVGALESTFASHSTFLRADGVSALLFVTRPEQDPRGIAVLAIDLSDGQTFVGVSDRAGETIVLGNARLEAALRRSSPTNEWANPIGYRDADWPSHGVRTSSATRSSDCGSVPSDVRSDARRICTPVPGTWTRYDVSYLAGNDSGPPELGMECGIPTTGVPVNELTVQAAFPNYVFERSNFHRDADCVRASSHDEYDDALDVFWRRYPDDTHLAYEQASDHCRDAADSAIATRRSSDFYCDSGTVSSQRPSGSLAGFYQRRALGEEATLLVLDDASTARLLLDSAPAGSDVECAIDATGRREAMGWLFQPAYTPECQFHLSANSDRSLEVRSTPGCRTVCEGSAPRFDGSYTLRAPPSGATTMPAVSSVREVDWRNFTHPGVLFGSTTPVDPFTTVDGEVAERDGSRTSVRAPVYGDVDRDGAEEALIVVDFDFGGTMGWTCVLVYGIRDGRATFLGGVPDRENGTRGGIRELDVQNGRVVFERWETLVYDNRCPCRKWREVWEWNGREFIENVRMRRNLGTVRW